MKRLFLIVGGLVVVAVIAIAVFVWTSAGSLIKEAVESVGSDVTKAEVTLDEVDLDLASGKGALRGLDVGNPAGFKTPNAFTLGAVSVAVDPATVTSDPIVINEIVIDQPSVTYEIGPDGTNIDALQANVNEYKQAHGLGGDGAAQEAPAGESRGPKLIIENIYVRGGSVNVSASILEGEQLSAGLPDIHLQDVGKDEGGASPAVVAERIIASLTQAAEKAASEMGVGKTLDSLRGALEGATGDVGKTLEDATGAVGEGAEGVGGAVQEGVEGAGDSIKKLLDR